MRDYKNVPTAGSNNPRADGQFKLDTGKTPIARGLFAYFPRALKAVADVSQYGYEKYREWGGWKKLHDAPNRYEDAMARHQLDMAKGEKFDPESGRWHIAHRAWNALATLELALIELENSMIKPDPKPRPEPKGGYWKDDNTYVKEQMDPVSFGGGGGNASSGVHTGAGGAAPNQPVDSRSWTGGGGSYQNKPCGDLPTREDYPR